MEDPYSSSGRAESYQLLSWLAEACHERHALHRSSVRRTAVALDEAISLGSYGAVSPLLSTIIAEAIAAARWRSLGKRFKARSRATAAGDAPPLSPAARQLAWRLLIGRPLAAPVPQRQAAAA